MELGRGNSTKDRKQRQERNREELPILLTVRKE